MRKTIAAISSLLSAVICLAGAGSEGPSGTYLFAEKDGVSLYLDVYDPSPDAPALVQGKDNPTIVFVFGGGFKSGKRDQDYLVSYYRTLAEKGFRVVAPDYRLGMAGFKGKGLSKDFINTLRYSIDIAVEDLFSATAFLVKNADSLGIDPGCIIAAGSSAGAITAMQGEWEICEGSPVTGILPEGFNYAGIMSFSGAVFTDKGGAKYGKEPCPTLIFHGTADKIVPYGKMQLGKLFFGGARPIARSFAKNGYDYNVIRYLDKGHEVATSMPQNLDIQLQFITHNVLLGEKRIIDATFEDPSIKPAEWAKGDYKGLYN